MLDLRADGARAVEAFAYGYEVEIALARGVNPYHYELGFHPTATLGTLAAAAAAARLLELDTTRTTTALGIAASLASGIKANFGTMTKPLHCGWAAQAGIAAASLARYGFSAHPAAYEAIQGFGPVLGGPTWRTEPVIASLGRPWKLVDPGVTLRKFWPCCGAVHTTIEAVRRLRRENSIDSDEVREVRCGVHARRLPHSDRANPTTGEEGRFSNQFCAAVALLRGDVSQGHFADAVVNDPPLCQSTFGSGGDRSLARADRPPGADSRRG